MNLAWWLETGAWEHPQKTALIDPDGSEITYAELNALSNKAGNLLRDGYGIGPGDIVTTLAGETHWHVALMFGLWKIGAVFCPLNRTQSYPKFIHDVRITKSKLLIAEPKFTEVAKQLTAERGIPKAALLGDESDGLADFRALARSAGDRLRMTRRRTRT